MVDWQPSGPPGGGGYTDIGYAAAQELAKITISLPGQLSEQPRDGPDARAGERAAGLARLPLRP